jgi:hypothetical protein
MRSHRVPLVAAGLALATLGLVTGCSGGAAAPAAPAPSASATATPAAPASHTTAAAAPATPEKGGTGDDTGPGSAPASEGATPGVEPVSCGPVGPEGGAQVDLIADSTAAGRVGCTEAINVITAYYRDAPTKSEGTAHHLVVDGWDCLADTGAYGSGSIGCDKDGFAFHTEP